MRLPELRNHFCYITSRASDSVQIALGFPLMSFFGSRAPPGTPVALGPHVSLASSGLPWFLGLLGCHGLGSLEKQRLAVPDLVLIIRAGHTFGEGCPLISWYLGGGGSERPHEERRQTLSKDLKDVRRETHRHLGGGVLSLGNNRCQRPEAGMDQA